MVDGIWLTYRTQVLLAAGFLSFLLKNNFLKINLCFFWFFFLFCVCVFECFTTSIPGAQGGMEQLCHYWESNLGPVQGRQVLPTTEPTLQPWGVSFCRDWVWRVRPLPL